MSDHNDLSLVDRLVNLIGSTIFAIRWLLAPMYLLLYAALAVYMLKYAEEIFHLLIGSFHEKSSVIMLAILELIDMTMIANLVVMTTTGGYSIFVKEFGDDIKNRPRWLSKNFSSAEQKIKLIWSLIGVGAVTLLNDFIKADITTWDEILKKSAILGVFIMCGFAYCMYNLMMHHPIIDHHKSDDKKEH
jgi:uncharacterized protein (TIGR00645 family)